MNASRGLQRGGLLSLVQFGPYLKLQPDREDMLNLTFPVSQGFLNVTVFGNGKCLVTNFSRIGESINNTSVLASLQALKSDFSVQFKHNLNSRVTMKSLVQEIFPYLGEKYLVQRRMVCLRLRANIISN